MNTESTPHHINAESVESIVTKYVELWGYTPAQTKIEIHKSFEMGEDQIQRALDHLDATYGKKKAPTKHNKYDQGDISDVVGG